MLLEYSCAMQRKNTHRWRKRNMYKYVVAIAIVFHIYTDVLSAAPAPFDSLLPQSSEIASEYFSDISGCYYNFQRYEEGDRIVTNEPCLNCTCHNRMLMCYLRVCPFSKAIGQDCTIEKKPDQCCPIITCPEVPVKLLTSSTTSSPTPTTQTTEVGFHDNYGCSIQDSFYADGAQVPPDPRKPCELCYCIRNRTACVMQECTLNVEGCKPVFQEGICCPVRYDCDYEKEVISTPLSHTSGGVIKSTTYATVVDCQYGNQSYSDGELITTDKPCEHCYCMRGDIVCAVQDCGEPLRGKDCVPTMPPPERCCPSYYDCPNDTVTTETINKGSDFSTENPERGSWMTPESSVKTERTPSVLSSEQIYQKLGESKKPTSNSTLIEKVGESTSSKPSSKHPSEDIQLNENAIDAGEHFTTNGPKEVSSSFASSETPSEKAATTPIEFHTTTEYVTEGIPLLNEHSSTSKQQPSLSSMFEQNSPTTIVISEASTDVVTDGLTKTTLHPGDQFSADHTISEQTVSNTEIAAAGYTKSSESRKTEASTVEKVTESLNDSASAVTGESPTEDKSTDKLSYETTTNEYVKPIVNSESNSTDMDQIFHEHSSSTNQYQSTVHEVDKGTTLMDKEEPATKFSDEAITQKVSSVSETQKESGTENLNTIADKNTESLMQNDINIINTGGKSPAVLSATQHIAENIETTTKYSSYASPSLTSVEVAEKPESVSEIIVTTQSVEDITTVPSSGVVPGEGSCLVDGITYPNMSIIESSNPCHSKCECLSSIPTCVLITCSSPPNDPKCIPIQMKPESCCPVYVCDGNEQPPPAHHIPSHNQIASDEPESEHGTEEIAEPSATFTTTQSSYIPIEDAKIPVKNSESVFSVIREKETTVSIAEGTESNLASAKPQDNVHVTETVLLVTEHVSAETKHPILHNADGMENRVPLTTEAGDTLQEITEFIVKNVSNGSGINSTTYFESTTIREFHNDDTEASVYTEQYENDIATKKHEQLSTASESDLSENTFNEISTPPAVVQQPNKEAVTVNENIDVFNVTEGNEETDYHGDKLSTPATVITTTKKNIEEFSEVPTTENIGITSQETAFEEDSHSEDNIVTTLPPISQSIASQNSYSNKATESYHTTVISENSSEHNYEVPTTVNQVVESSEDETHVTVTETVLLNSDSKFTEIPSPVTTIKSDTPDEEVDTTHKGVLDNEEDNSTNDQYQTTGPVSEYTSSIPTSSVTPESVKLTEKVSVDVTEVYESLVTSTTKTPGEIDASVIPDGINEISGVEGMNPSVEEDTTTVRPNYSLPGSDEINEITSNGSHEKIPNDFGTTVPTNHSPDLPLSGTDHSYVAETTIKQSYIPNFSQAVTEFVNIKTTLPSSSNSPNEVSYELTVTTVAPVPTSQQEDQQTIKISESNDVTQPEIVTTQLFSSSESSSVVISEQNYVTVATETNISNSTEKHSSVNSNSPSLETSSENVYSPTQQSTWTRKPVGEEVTSEQNYYPQGSMYPPGFESQSPNVEGTGVEDYEEDNNAFGPGTCRYAGKVYVSAQQIPRDDPCDFCFCFRSDIICLQQSCPPPIHGCRQEPIQGFCCPRYECPVARDITFNNATSIPSTTITTTRTTTTLQSRPPRFPFESYRNSNRRTGCVIHGKFYNVGDDIAIASGPCLECICGSDGQMKCDPKSCSPEPYVQQMIAESAFHR